MNDKGAPGTREASEVQGIYVAYSDTAEKNIDRRFLANKFFFTMSAGISIAASVLIAGSPTKLFLQIVGTVAFWTLILNSIAWALSLAYFRKLSAVKYQVLHEIEQQLALKPFSREWEIMKLSRNRLPGNTAVEFAIPIVLAMAGTLIWVCLLIYGTEIQQHLIQLRAK